MCQGFSTPFTSAGRNHAYTTSGLRALGGCITSAIVQLDRHVIELFDPASNTITPLAGAEGLSDHVNGAGTVARLHYPYDGTLTASFDRPKGIAQDAASNLYVADALGYVIRKISGGQVTTIAGDGTAGAVDDSDPLQARFYGLEGIGVVASGKIIYVADGNVGDGSPHHRVRRVAFP